jgi:hypothetical protein
LGQHALEQNETAQGFDISFNVVALARMAASDHDPVCPFPQGFEDKLGIDSAAAHNPDNAHIRRVMQS